jgi:hypothetical protein
MSPMSPKPSSFTGAFCDGGAVGCVCECVGGGAADALASLSAGGGAGGGSAAVLVLIIEVVGSVHSARLLALGVVGFLFLSSYSSTRRGCAVLKLAFLGVGAASTRA